MTRPTRLKQFIGLVLLGPCFGCAGYQVGPQTLFRPDIQTVHVPVFQSDSLRRFLGERLTEAVVKQIELTTPYKVTQRDRADSVLYGRIVNDSKYVINENVNDEPRDIEFELYVEISWRDRNGQSIVDPYVCGIPAGFVEVAQATHFVPEAGQSLGTAQQQGYERLADQIVAHMNVPW